MAQFDAVGVVVADMARTREFYALLGVELPDATETEGHIEVEITPDFRVMFDTIETVESFSTYVPPSGGRTVGFAFRCASPAEVDELHRSVTDAGFASTHEPFDAFWGQRYATVLDPDGNPCDLYAPLD